MVSVGTKDTRDKVENSEEEITQEVEVRAEAREEVQEEIQAEVQEEVGAEEALAELTTEEAQVEIQAEATVEAHHTTLETTEAPQDLTENGDKLVNQLESLETTSRTASSGVVSRSKILNPFALASPTIKGSPEFRKVLSFGKTFK